MNYNYFQNLMEYMRITESAPPFRKKETLFNKVIERHGRSTPAESDTLPFDPPPATRTNRKIARIR